MRLHYADWQKSGIRVNQSRVNCSRPAKTCFIPLKIIPVLDINRIISIFNWVVVLKLTIAECLLFSIRAVVMHTITKKVMKKNVILIFLFFFWLINFAVFVSFQMQAPKTSQCDAKAVQQAHRHLLSTEREAFKIVVHFDHTVCFPFLSACTKTVTFPPQKSFDYVLRLASQSGVYLI
uniref:Uncharacterized protein n=1 Tax=Oryzias latipes TaxID=8090 RepID=A0A3B3HEB8_ORYLA